MDKLQTHEYVGKIFYSTVSDLVAKHSVLGLANSAVAESDLHYWSATVRRTKSDELVLTHPQQHISYVGWNCALGNALLSARPMSPQIRALTQQVSIVPAIAGTIILSSDMQNTVSIDSKQPQQVVTQALWDRSVSPLLPKPNTAKPSDIEF